LMITKSTNIHTALVITKSTNIHKANNHILLQTIEQKKKTTTFVNENPGPGLGSCEQDDIWTSDFM
jgi:hypothetical protein